MTSTRSGKPRPTTESTTPAIFNPGVTVELEPGGVSGGVSGGGREIRKEVKLLGYDYSWCTGNGNTTYTKLVIAVLQHCRCTGNGNTT